MQTTYLLWIFLHFIIEGATKPPTWTVPVSTSISKASTECGDVTNLSADSGDGSSVIYSLLSQSPTDGVFTITDDIFGNKILTCDKGSITVASNEVVVRAEHDGGNGLHADLTLTITFTDVASGPTWTSGTSYSLDKSDCSACDAVATLSATSTDSSSVTYSFVSGSGFCVSGSTLSCTITSLTVSSHSVVVRAQNTGDNATTDQTLTVTVTDSSPAAPTWSTGISHWLNKGDSTACDAVTTLSATSSDCTAVTYSFQSESPSGGFSVTGNTLSCDLASITASSYTVAVRATNTGDGANSDLTLTITPAEAPVFVKPSPNDADDDHLIALLETIQAGETVLTLSATDADTDNATLTFNMDASVEETRQLFEIIGRKLKVKTGVPNDYFDAEKDGVVLQYPIVLEVSDGGSSTTLSTTIDVQDVNDNSPEFSGTFTTEIRNDVPEGYTVFTITATDSDKTATNNNVTLSLSDISAFNLDGDKIKVSAGVIFDVKTQSSYTLTVTASDNALVDPKTTDQDFNVTIKAAPEFVDPDPDDNSELQIIYMCETIQAGDEVMTLNASDADTDAALLSFNMENSSNTTKALFEVVGDKLKVKADVNTTVFDFDTDNAVIEYSIILGVSDGAFTTTLTTTIRVEDDNDNAPEFSGDTTAYILESSLAGTRVLNLTATDKDKSAEYNNVTFSLSGATKFEIGGDNRDVILVANGASFEYETKSSYTLNITASDNAPEEAKTTDLNISVSITTDPKFNKLDFAKTVSVDENATETTVIYVLDVTDKDGTGTLTVSISEQPSPEMFRLDGRSLKPKSGAAFDAEGDKTSYQLKFKASDGTYKTESEVLTVTVNDVNDNPPVFTELSPEVNISEKEAGGTIVYDVNATDADVGNPNNTMKYSMMETDTSHFRIDTDSGIIYVEEDATLVYSSKAEYKLVVTAQDGDGPTDNSAKTNVTVRLHTQPKFNKLNSAKNASVYENATDTTEIYVLDVTDEDGSGTLTISISEQPSPEMFRLDGQSLKPTSGATFDAEGDTTSYQLKFKASDGTCEKESEALTVTVNDVNDNPPVFTEVDPVVNISEKAAAGTTVLSVTATDDDLTEANNKIKYSMTGTDFSIDPDTGDITVSASLSYKTKSEYDITVTATDTGTPPKNATQQVKFTLLAEPQFVNLTEPKSKDINENLHANASVFTISVSDLDNTWDGNVSIVSQTPHEMFKIKGNILETKTDGLDAENTTTYVLKFKVMDGSFVVESANLTFNILDLNDNPPVISTVPNVTITENMTTGTVVFDVQATDKDVTTQNNVLSYTITAGNDDKVFAIDAVNGSLSLNKTLAKETYNLEVMVSDSGSTILTATTNVSIFVDRNVIDECPTNPCQNGGNCSSSVNVYICQCVPGNAGTNCEKFSVHIIMVMDRDCPDLENSSVYAKEKNNYENSVQRSLNVSTRVVVTNITCGSLIFESNLEIDKNDAEQLAKELSVISNSIKYDGQVVPIIEFKINDIPVRKSDTEAKRVCDAYTAIEPCAEGYECKYENGRPSCRKLGGGEENTVLILALGLGVCLPLIVFAVLAACYLYLYQYQSRKCSSVRKSQNITENGRNPRTLKYSLREKGSWIKEESPWHGRMKQSGFKIDTRHYDRNRFNENANYENNIYYNRHYYDMPGLLYTSV